MKKNIEKIIYILLNIAVIAGFAAFIFFNFDKTAQYFCPIMQKTFTTSIAGLGFMIFLTAYISGFVLCLLIKSRTDELCNAYQKRHENISIEKDENTAKIAVLEAKIQTLETALENALKNK